MTPIKALAQIPEDLARQRGRVAAGPEREVQVTGAPCSASAGRNGGAPVDRGGAGSHPPYVEVELKLLVDPKQLATLADSPQSLRTPATKARFAF